MFRVEQAQIPIEDASGRRRGWVEIHLLPGDEALSVAPLLDRRGDSELEPGMAGVQLLESREYRYAFVLETGGTPGHVSTDRPEIFRPDTAKGLMGRIRPGLYTGTLPVSVFVDGQRIGAFDLEVRASKLDYLSHYKWMLRDLADTFAEVIMRRFAPTETRFTFRADADASTLYQRFAFLKSIMMGDTFEVAITQILSVPHREWREEEQLRPTGQSIPSGPGVARAVVRGGPRVPWPGQRGAAVLDSLPARMLVQRSFESFDTLPNRFVKYVLMQWRNTVAEMARTMVHAPESATTQRGRLEAEGVLSALDEVLAQPLFQLVAPLTQSPVGNQVLQKQAGYRDMYKLYIQSELAAMLSWSGGEDVYSAGQKDVAVLYEYWVFIQLANVISTTCRQRLPLERLVETDANRIDLRLKQGRHRVLAGTAVRHGRVLEIELWYNRAFPRGTRHGSWTRPLRPDYSLRIRVPGYRDDPDELWIHFDAKYRLDTLMEIFSDGTAESGSEGTEAAVENIGRPVADDLLKMHAYRDAIRRSSGAYVIYPGTEDQVLHRYHEILPGLGAFALRPARDGLAEGVTSIREFISDVLDHAASQISQHERHRYWEKAIFGEEPDGRTGGVGAVAFLSRPPADTRVLLGYVRSDQHYRWINETGLYNMRADERTGSVGLHSEQLAAELVLLYGPSLVQSSLRRVSGDPRLLNVQRMVALNYPDPRSSIYYCLPVELIVDDTNWLSRLTYSRVLEVVQEHSPGSPYGAPIATTWDRLVELLSVRR